MKKKGYAKGGMKKKGYAMGGMKPVPESNTGLSKLPEGVRNKMGYMSYGGKPKKMKHGGSCGGMGKAVRGGKFSRNG